MALHLIKLAVGVDDLAHMKKVQAARRKQRRQSPRSPHWVYTRNTPRRAAELLADKRAALTHSLKGNVIPLPPGAGRLRGGFR